MCCCNVSECARARLSGLRQSVNVHISISVGRSVLRMTRWEAGLVPTPPSPTALSATGSIHHPPPRLTFVLRRMHLVQRESRRGVPTLNWTLWNQEFAIILICNWWIVLCGGITWDFYPDLQQTNKRKHVGQHYKYNRWRLPPIYVKPRTLSSIWSKNYGRFTRL